MQHYWTLSDLKLSNAWLAIGSFDGVHCGHQKILTDVIRQAHVEGAPAVGLSFFPHPADVLGKRKGPFYLTTPEEKIELIAGLGVDHLIIHPFNKQIASMSAREFVQVLQQKTDFHHLVIGPDFTLGKDREGDVSRLRELGDEMNFTVRLLKPLSYNGRTISSSWVREALAEGDMQLVKELLGRKYSLSGTVVLGDQRGRALGFPTANLAIWQKLARPGNGVYAGFASVHGMVKPAAINIGYRPTFIQELRLPNVEVHILEFDEQIYGCELEVQFIKRLRGEIRFNSAAALIDQVQEDIRSVYEIMETQDDAAISRSPASPAR